MHYEALRLLSAAATASTAATASATPVPPDKVPQEAQTSVERWVSSTFELGLWGTIIYTAIVAAITFLIITILKKQLWRKMGGNMRFFYRLIYAIVIIIAVVTVMSTITPLKNLGNAILASSGIAGVIVGLAAQESLSNVFSGISLASAKPFEVGEYIELPGTSPPIAGTVITIDLRHTIIQDVSNKEIVIPNSVLDHDIIQRMRSHKSKAPAIVNNFLEVGVSYDSDIERAMDIMATLVAKQPEFVDTRSEEEINAEAPLVTVRVTALADSSINLRATVPTHTIGEGFKALSDLRLLVKKNFDKEGISIPYPYRNVVLQNAPEQVKKPEEAQSATAQNDKTEEAQSATAHKSAVKLRKTEKH